MASDIAIVSLTATAAVGGFTLAALWAPPSVQASLPYMQAASVVFYASATNDFGAATVVGESPAVGIVQVGGLGNAVTRYVWARAKDPAGNLGDRYPAAGGVAVTTLNPAPGPNSIGTGQLQNGAVTNEKVTSIAADKITAGTINATIAINGPTITGGLMRTAASGQRVEINSATQRLTAYNAGNAEVARFGAGGSGLGNFSLFASSPGQCALLQATSGQVGVQVENFSSGLALTAGATSGHGFRGYSNTGGMGIVGASGTGGGHAFVAEIGGYAPFTGCHDALLPMEDEAFIGEIVCSADLVVAQKGVDDALLVVGVSDVEKQRGAYGIVASSSPFDPYSPIAGLPPLADGEEPTPFRLWIAKTYQRLAVNGCGEGLVLVCGRGGDIAVGDYICTSSMRGKGQRMDMSAPATLDTVSCIVAQATKSVTFDDPDEVRLVACIFKCG